MEDGTGDTSSTDAAVPQGEGSSQESKPNGLQARIDELTAKAYAAEARADQQAQLNATLTGRLAELSSRPAAETVEETDPEKRLLNRMEQMERRFSAALNQVGAGVAVSQVGRAAAEAGVDDPRIVARAEQLAFAWKNQGRDLNPGDAVNFAIGEHYRASKGKGVVPRSAAGNNPMLNQGTPAPAAVRRNAVPENINTLSPDAQYAALEAAGVGDTEF